MPEVMKRVRAVAKHRNASARPATQALADVPHLFGEIRQPIGRYILLPAHSSERRAVIPIGFMPKEVIVGNANLCIPNAGLYEFGVLTSRMHMTWVSHVCGRIKSDYRYTNQIVYNNFPWPDLDRKSVVAQVIRARAAIEIAAQAVLDARALEAGATLAELYNPPMPEKLLKAHRELDAAVMLPMPWTAARKHGSLRLNAWLTFLRCTRGSQVFRDGVITVFCTTFFEQCFPQPSGLKRPGARRESRNSANSDSL